MSAHSQARRAALAAHDAAYWDRGLRISGIDEAGCGALAGPVIAACVGMPSSPIIDGVDDSKKLSPAQRERLYDRILESAWFAGIGMSDVEEIESINILNAAKLAMARAAEGLNASDESRCDVALVDARNPRLRVRLESIVHGDAVSYSIAAASIIAKVTRDRIMAALDKEFPGYGFANHKGYGTAAHYETILTFGPSKIHRASFLKKLDGKMDRVKLGGEARA
ncbi:MAG: ribonuclease HII [Oscillospiraceae bacterium]|nr:ribonuclease HII [Oscillospiraceae bacterium]